MNYEDERRKIDEEQSVALNQMNDTYNNMINQSQDFYNAQVQAAKDYATTQSGLQKQQTDFAIEQINQQKEQAQKDYLKEQKGAYTDWQKQSNQYGVNAEQMAAQGLKNTGYSESSQVSMYNTYQNRVATAKESYNKAVLNYDNGIKEAQLQNNSVLAEIAYKALESQLQVSLEGFQYKNTLLQQQIAQQQNIEDRYYARWQDVLDQMNKERAYNEEVRQFNEKLAEDRRQFNVAQANAMKKAQAESVGFSSGSSGFTSGGSANIDAANNFGNSSATTKKSDYYFKSTTGEDYQPRYVGDTKLTKSGKTLADIGKINGIKGDKNIWKVNDDLYVVWDEDIYVDVTDLYKKSR